MPTSPHRFVDQVQANLYRSHSLNNEYTLLSGKFSLPVAEEPPVDPGELASWSPVVVVAAHAPYRLREAVFEVQKNGTPPMIPSPEDTGAHKFLGGSLYFHGPQIDPQASGFVWTVTGSYIFAEYVRSDPGDGFILGSFPFETSLSQFPKNTFGTNTVPQFGAVTLGGGDVRAAFAESQSISFTNPLGYTYYSTSFFPGVHCNPGLLNGDTNSIGIQAVPTSIPVQA